jgi:cell division protein FtsA
MAQRKNAVVGLDVGTTKICAVVAEPGVNGDINILGTGSAPSKGLQKGVVVDIDSTVDSIDKAIEDAENASGVEIYSVFVGIAGGHIQGKNSRGVVPITSENNEISQDDVDHVIHAAKAINIPIDREIIHAIPQDYIVDGKPGIKNPVGLCGMRLEADVHVVTGAVMSAHNIVKCINTAGMQVEDIVLQPLASSLATLNMVEKDSGVIMIDIGGGTTDYIIYNDNIVCHSDVLSLGGDDITSDIAKVLRIPRVRAEELKMEYGCALLSSTEERDTFPLPATVGSPERDEPLQTLTEIIEYRMREILSISKEEIQREGFGDIVGSGVVLSGGTSMLRSCEDLASDIFNNMNIRIGCPRGITGDVKAVDTPIYATGVGLAKYGIDFRHKGREPRISKRNMFKDILARMQLWVTDKVRKN